MVTDVAFLEVFRYLRVEEFRMESRIPLVSVKKFYKMISTFTRQIILETK